MVRATTPNHSRVEKDIATLGGSGPQASGLWFYEYVSLVVKT
jgi:hypothetical protein